MNESLVFISGASSGIGLALAQSVPFPARVIDLSRRGAPGFEHVKADLATPEGWDAAAACFQRELAGFAGERAVFVHAAGTLTPIGFAGETEPAAYRQAVLLNSASTQVLGDAFLRALQGCETPAHILMISSGAASSEYPGWSHYCAGKAAMDLWVRSAGAEQERRGGRCQILAVAPGIVATPMQEEIRATPERDFPDVERFVAYHEEGQLRAPEDAAQALWALLARGLPNGSVLDLRD